ncbi:MAG: hypothetical protein GX665_09720 [Gammaproteobacteria bacterium]|nr:hypothetical protein [Gammaproteobacteria bacterium]
MLYELRQLTLHLLLIPLVFLLPWSLCFRILRFLTRLGLAGNASDDEAWMRMQRHGFMQPRHLAVRQIRLHRLADLSDFYRSWRLRPAWLKRYWRVTGDPLPDPAQHPAVLFVTFHYGAGFLALRHFREHGLHMAALYRPPPRPPQGSRFDYHFFWWRLRSILRLTRVRPIRVGDNQSELKMLVQRLVKDRQPVGFMPDIPTPRDQAIAADFLGGKIYFATGLLRLIAKYRVPVVLYTSVLDLEDGGRNVDLQVLYDYDSLEDLASAFAACLEQAIRRDPTAWHLWAFADEILIT